MYTIYEYEQLMHQYGENYAFTQQGDGGFVGEYETIEEAREAFDAYQFSEDAYITRTKRGLDSITYFTIALYGDKLDEDGEFVEELEFIDGRENLPEEWYDAAMAHRDAYWKFLDYKASSYPALTDLING